MEVPSLDPGCPWYELSEWALPNVKWCEASHCSWIVEPANTWSNLAFVLVAAVLWWQARGTDERWLRLFAPAAMVVGVTSFVYHASYTFVFQVGDFVGMFVFVGLALALNLHRLWQWRVVRVWLTVVAAGTVLVFVLYFAELPIQAIVAALILAVVASEVTIRRRGLAVGGPAAGGAFVAALALLAAAGVCSLLDVTRVWCQPEHPFLQGHALWHLLSAGSMLPLFSYYRRVLD